MSASFKTLENLAERYRLQAEIYYLQLEAKKNSSDALVALSGIIVKMYADLSKYEQKNGKTAVSESRREIINALEQISDVFYPLWIERDNAVTLLKSALREKEELSRDLEIVKKELEMLKKTFDEL